MKITAVLMAGGKGERFWPYSRQRLPKQFLPLMQGEPTMLQQTAARLAPLVEMQDIYVVASQEYIEVIKAQLPQLPRQNILAEPFPRSTAPAVALAGAAIMQRHEDAIMLVLPSDHLIQPLDGFVSTMRDAARVAQLTGDMVTIGVPPAYAETGYGYIRYAPDKLAQGYYPVEAFVEKPDANTARGYLDSGRYFWNSGMFVWTMSTLKQCLKGLLPSLYEGMHMLANAWRMPQFDDVLAQQYQNWPSESIDYGLMERAENIAVIPAGFHWDDVGSWLALQRLHPLDDKSNMIQGDVVSVDSSDCIFVGQKRVIAALGVEGLVVVDTPDALLICAKDRVQDVKKITSQLRSEDRYDVL